MNCILFTVPCYFIRLKIYAIILINIWRYNSGICCFCYLKVALLIRYRYIYFNRKHICYFASMCNNSYIFFLMAFYLWMNGECKTDKFMLNIWIKKKINMFVQRREYSTQMIIINYNHLFKQEFCLELAAL